MDNSQEIRAEIEKFRRGDQAAAQRLYDGHAELVLAIIKGILPTPDERDRGVSSDLRQEAFASFFRVAENGDYDTEQSNFVGLLVTIARRKAYLFFRKRRVPIPYSDDQIRFLIDAEHAARSGVVSHQELVAEWRDTFERITATLPMWKRDIIAHRVDIDGGWTIDEIGKRCACEAEVVRAVVKEFKLRLKTFLDSIENDVSS